MKENLHFLNEHIFHGLTNLNNGFDSESIKYFSSDEFEIVLQRIQKLKLGIYGIEPWLNGSLFDVLTCEDFNKSPTDAQWYLQAFQQFKEMNSDLFYSASYQILATSTSE